MAADAEQAPEEEKEEMILIYQAKGLPEPVVIGKHALVCGGSEGIGRATALAFAREGVQVVAVQEVSSAAALAGSIGVLQSRSLPAPVALRPPILVGVCAGSVRHGHRRRGRRARRERPRGCLTWRDRDGPTCVTAVPVLSMGNASAWSPATVAEFMTA